MRIAFVADGRSPITRAWIKNMLPLGHELHLISSYPCEDIPGVVSTRILPLAFSGTSASIKKTSQNAGTSALYQKLRLSMLAVRSYLGPLTLSQTSKPFREYLDQIKPDLVHALRIPFEGMAAAATPPGIPLIISSWGNDFTLHAASSPFMRQATGRAMRRADGFTADCMRDIRLAKQYGLSADAPTLFAPGNGGFDLSQFEALRKKATGQGGHTVINPRGIRPAYVRNNVFFQAIPIILKEIPDACFECPGMLGQAEAEKWMKQNQLSDQVKLLQSESQELLWQRFTRNSVVVSPATHDGTPNSVLEAMALGCLPVVGNIESLREWIKDGVNGLLVDSNDPASVAQAIIRGLRDKDLLSSAKEKNWELICEKADSEKVRVSVDNFYNKKFY